MIRGSGLKGLCGIPYQRKNIIRPLLDCARQQILDYAKENQLTFVYDETNSDTTYTRNFIRQELIPRALRINPGFLKSSAMTANLMTTDEQFLFQSADAVFQKGRQTKDAVIFLKNDLIPIHDALLSRIVIRAYERLSNGKQLTAHHVSNSLRHIKNQGKNKSIGLPGQVVIDLSFDQIIFRREKPRKKDLFALLKKDGDSVTIEEMNLTLTYKVTDNATKNMETHVVYYINYDIINNTVFLRNRRQKDAFVPLGGIGKKSLNKMLIREKVPRYQRDILPVLCCGDEVIWAYGLSRINDKYKITRETKKILKLEIKEADGLV
jgi:tRNA(Ile)-lysidine synthase